MIQIKVSIEPYAPSYLKYHATLAEWDLGVPIGSAGTIQDAIDDFLDRYWDIWCSWNPDSLLESIPYKWS